MIDKGAVSKLSDKTQEYSNVYLPEIFRLSQQEDRKKFNELITNGSIFLHDEMYEHLKEMFKCRNPKRALTETEYKELIAAHLAGKDIIEYGAWVYYRWSKRLVHILDEGEFIEVRTSRNQYKITLQERDLLSEKRVGVVGLSVGQSVAVTMAMERSFKEIRLADFDVLELTNLNRIRTGVQNLGIKKVISVAREIAEIDPFLKVTIFDEGLNDDNMDAFFLNGGKLDAIIDECDSVDIKVSCRVKAKALGVPVLMEASDRCTIDVERFDLEPDRPILHGFIEHLDISKLKYLKTNEEKMPYLAPIVGLNTISTRLKASGVEIGQTITTWPQLASAVALGGGAVADIWRRIALGEYKGSGRFFVDMEQLVGDKEVKDDDGVALNPFEPLVLEDIKKISRQAIKDSYKGDAVPAQEQIWEIVDKASTAPSGGNAQPWKWVYHNGVLALFFDRYYGYSFMDYRDSASFIALGAAIENVILKAHELGFEIKVHYSPANDNDDIIAFFSFYKKDSSEKGLEPHVEDQLSKVIERRHTNRRIVPRVEIEQDAILQLKNSIADIKGAQLHFYSDLPTLEELGKIISETDRYRVLYPQSHHDFTYQEMRWTEAEAIERRTGMGVNTLELSGGDLLGLRLVRDPKVVAILRKMNGGDVLRTVSVKNTMSASVMGILTMPEFRKEDFIIGGRASQRLWLKATELNLAFHPMNVPFAYFSRVMLNPSDLPSELVPEIEKLYKRFTTVLGQNTDKAHIYMFRLFKAPEPSVLPYRKHIEDILVMD